MTYKQSIVNTDQELEVDFGRRYWVFAYNTYYPDGGLEDVDFTFDTLEEAFLHAIESNYDTTKIFDSDTKKLTQVKVTDW